jgi:hypothetical protein
MHDTKEHTTKAPKVGVATSVQEDYFCVDKRRNDKMLDVDKPTPSVAVAVVAKPTNTFIYL